MDTLETIRTRRSVRKYEDRPVPDELVQKLLAAAMNAPSARNQQPWQFVVIDDRRMLAEVAEINPNAQMAGHAPLGIMVCGDLSLEKSPGYWVVDCAAAVENMLLAITALGYATVWLDGALRAGDRAARIGRLLGVPAGRNVQIVLPIGTPVEPGRPREKLPFEQRAWYNHYGEDGARS